MLYPLYSAAVSEHENIKRLSTGEYYTYMLDADKLWQRFTDYMKKA